MSSSRSTFDASFPGVCDLCGDPFDEGEEIAYLDDEIVCKDCWEENR